MVEKVSDDDSTLIVDACCLRMLELAWLIAFGAELEQERAIDRRQYLHSMIVRVSDDDSMSIMIDRHSGRLGEVARSVAVLADREQERAIAGVADLQTVIARVCDDDAIVRVIKRRLARIGKPSHSCGELEQERALDQRVHCDSAARGARDKQSLALVIERDARWFGAGDRVEHAWRLGERVHTNAAGERVHNEQAIALGAIECEALDPKLGRLPERLGVDHQCDPGVWCTHHRRA